MVYDLTIENFRELDPSNFNDDSTIGLIFLDKCALKIIKQAFLVCGYLLIHKNSKFHLPIDIREDGITILESVYNRMSKNLQSQLKKFILDTKPYPMFTKFFIEWQFDCDEDCFINNGALIKLSTSCINHNGILDKLIKYDCHLICPDTYPELCEITYKLKKVFEFTIHDKDYNDSFKYIVDGLINKYYIRFNNLEVIQYFYNICTICNEMVR